MKNKGCKYKDNENEEVKILVENINKTIQNIFLYITQNNFARYANYAIP